MIQTISDYENWRDSQHDRPMPDDGPDERSIRFYSHDYPADTTLEYTRTGNRSELRLSFSSEDPDMGTEEMLYAGENGESMQELVADLKADLTGYLDAADTSSFYQQQGISQSDEIQEDPLEEGMVIHSSILAWRIPMARGAWQATVHGVAKSRTQLSNYA